MNRIVTICLLRNEDRFLDRILANVLDFSDEILIADHQSTDRTAGIARRWAETCPKIQYRRIQHPRESHAWIRPYANTPTWAFGVDGDEIYDPAGLKILRTKLLAGDFDQYRQIYGHALHCEALDVEGKTATGYATPPCRTITKLYHFGAITDWEGDCPERFHGGRIVFRPGYTENDNCWMYRDVPWEEACFRCLHTVFLPRSSRDTESAPPRPNISEKNQTSLWQKALQRCNTWRGKQTASAYKVEKYRRGDALTLDVSAFFPDAEGV